MISRAGTREGNSMSAYGRHIAVLSPHLDDAALSLGGAIATATTAGAEVTIVTVFANDPDSSGPAGVWDSACGFHSAAAAARVRREEDRRACALLGATPIWLPLNDVEYPQEKNDDEVWDRVADATSGMDVMFIPGFPLVAPDHARLAHLLIDRPIPNCRLALYVEQPYATWRLIGRGGRTGAKGLTPRKGLENAFKILFRSEGGRRLQDPSEVTPGVASFQEKLDWLALPIPMRDWWTKQKAIRAYSSQWRGLGPLLLSRIAVYEAGWGGEGIAWPRSSEAQ